jgi:hypothetical protein
MNTEHDMRPQFRKVGATKQLFVNGAPVLLTAGEVRNSSSTSRAYMRPIWDKCAAAQLNTVLAVVPWDLTEPEEGRFDFTIIDELIDDARAYRMHLVPLWFGAWKNGLSHYVPHWVKTDPKRFPRARIAGGNLEILTTFSEQARDATARAFAALMHHIRERDAGTHTVIMVQVENEVGIPGDLRDRHPLAEQSYGAEVPAELIEHLVRHEKTLLPETLAFWKSRRTQGTWAEVFQGAEAATHVFMAWHYARFIGRSAELGKEAYDIPLFVNAALGPYPGSVRRSGPGGRGGPVAAVMDIWHAGAPAIDMLSPDIYRPDFEEALAGFDRADNPLFVPEGPAELEGAADAFYAVGQGAIGYSPFGVEERIADHASGPITTAYRLLNEIAPVILHHQAQGTIASARVSSPGIQKGGVRTSSVESLDRRVQEFVLGGYHWLVSLNHYWRSPEAPLSNRGYCLAMQVGRDEFLVAGFGIQIKYMVAEPEDRIVGFLSIEEVSYRDGEWTVGRRLSGDEIMTSYDQAALVKSNENGTQIKFWEEEPRLMRVKLYSYSR